jgi:hypothetical protein
MPRVTRPAVELYLAGLVRDHPTWGAPRLSEAIDAEYPPDAAGRRAISQSKIGTMLPRLRDRSGTWRLEPGESEPAFVLSVLDQQPGGRLTRRQVDWIRTVHAAATAMSPAGVLLVANLYLSSEVLELDEGRHHLDAALAAGMDPELIAKVADWNLDRRFGG